MLWINTRADHDDITSVVGHGVCVQRDVPFEDRLDCPLPLVSGHASATIPGALE